MGFLDKVKEQAQTVGAAAKEAAAKGQSKLDDLQAKKAADAMLRDLGVLTYASATSRESSTSEAEAGRLVSALQQHESEHGQLPLTLESAAGKGA